ncbi:hypothetical protein ACH42_17345 [Endozoicomonas sp. (ex Bugula neritina AB1)]|nr:hypothetical protein ACH42_17345 [Endozoicomonas sp. (ex Bugula neritina AB1)]
MPFIDFSGMPWKPQVRYPGEMPDEIREMILDHGSLTKQLKSIHNDEFFVEVIQHGWATPTASEQRFLQCEEVDASIREVLLYGSGAPVVFARSVLPRSSLYGENSVLLELGEKPLGEYLFSQPSLTRGAIEIAEIPARQFNPYLDVMYDNESAWGRRSLFYLNEKPISVCEVFLPVKESETDTSLKKSEH